MGLWDNYSACTGTGCRRTWFRCCVCLGVIMQHSYLVNMGKSIITARWLSPYGVWVSHRLDIVNPPLGQRCSRSLGPGNVWRAVWFSLQFLCSCPLWSNHWPPWGGPAEDEWRGREATSHLSRKRWAVFSWYRQDHGLKMHGKHSSTCALRL